MTIPARQVPLTNRQDGRITTAWYAHLETLGVGGAGGAVLRSGSGAPAGSLGNDDDFYIDTAADDLYGPKTAGAWGSPTSLIGPAGATGAAGSNGSAGATGADGAAGPQGFTIRGDDGEDGQDGMPGQMGATGATGPAGADGVIGYTIRGEDGEDGQPGAFIIRESNGIRTVGMCFDGGGSPPTAGSIGYLVVQVAGTITGWHMVADTSGSAVVDVWKAAGSIPVNANTIAGSEKPTLSAQQLNSDSNLTTWSTSVVPGDVLGFELESASTCTRVTCEISILGA